MVVDGQIYGGVAQGIGTALYEEMPFDTSGPAARIDLVRLSAARHRPRSRRIRIVHMETPSPYTEFGVKGIGEGGAIGPPAAIANAVNDALRPLGAAELLRRPMTPRRVLMAIAQAAERADRRGTGGSTVKPSRFEYERPADSRRRDRAQSPRGFRRKDTGRRPIARADAEPPSAAARSPGRHHRHPRVEARRNERRRGRRGRLRHPRGLRGRPRPRRHGRRAAARRARHRLPGRAQSRHDRRQPLACRSVGRLGVEPRGASAPK